MNRGNAVSGTYAPNRDNSDRPDASNNYGLVPAVTNPPHADVVALSWRWTPGATLTNEIRGGFNLTYAYFLNTQGNVPYIVTPPIPSGQTNPLFTDPINEGQAQGRTTNTYNLSDDAAWAHGRYYVQFGFHAQHIGVESYDMAVRGAPLELGRRAGVDGIETEALLSNATGNCAGVASGNPWYNRETKDFARNIGFAWDVFGNGRTALRGGYSMSYVNDQAILAPEYLLEINSGLRGLSTATGLTNRVSTGLPPCVVPPYQIPLTVADNYANNPFNTVGMLDPNLKHPRVQQYSIDVHHEFKRT